MKTIATLILMVAMVQLTNARSRQQMYVVTKTDTLYCAKLAVGPFKTHCVLLNGQKMVIDNDQIVEYAKNSKILTKITVYNKFTKTNQNRLVELVSSRNGIKVYKHLVYNATTDSYDAMFLIYNQQQLVYSVVNPEFPELLSSIDSVGQNGGTLVTIE